MPTRRHSPLAGIILILLGLILLLPTFTGLRLGELWPSFLLAAGVFFFALYTRDRRSFGVLMPGAILTIIALLFFACIAWGWQLMASFWPVFILAPGCGFLLMYFLGTREPGLLIPGIILTGIAFVFLTAFTEAGVVWPALLILLGLLLLTAGRKSAGTPPPANGGGQAT